MVRWSASNKYPIANKGASTCQIVAVDLFGNGVQRTSALESIAELFNK